MLNHYTTGRILANLSFSIITLKTELKVNQCRVKGLLCLMISKTQFEKDEEENISNIDLDGGHDIKLSISISV